MIYFIYDTYMDESITLDELDWRLLDLLQADASLTNHALAAAALCSPATALRRVKRLRDGGVIERITALVAPTAGGQGLSVICEVALDRQGAEHQAAFEARVVAHPAVQQCWQVSPGPDFVLVVWAPSMAAFSALTQVLFTQDANVRNVKSYFALKRSKFAPSIPKPLA